MLLDVDEAVGGDGGRPLVPTTTILTVCLALLGQVLVQMACLYAAVDEFRSTVETLTSTRCHPGPRAEQAGRAGPGQWWRSGPAAGGQRGDSPL